MVAIECFPFHEQAARHPFKCSLLVSSLITAEHLDRTGSCCKALIAVLEWNPSRGCPLNDSFLLSNTFRRLFREEDVEVRFFKIYNSWGEGLRAGDTKSGWNVKKKKRMYGERTHQLKFIFSIHKHITKEVGQSFVSLSFLLNLLVIMVF